MTGDRLRLLRNWSGAVFTVALAGCSAVRPPAGEPLLATLEVDAVSVEGVPLEGASPAGRDWFRALLAEQASAAARRTAFEHRLAAVIGHSPGDVAESHRLAGHMALPVALPSDLRGSRAAFRKGDLATARVELLDARGRVVAAADSSVGWAEVRWTTGGPKMRRARDSDLALLDAAELAIERAAKQLIDELRRRPASPTPVAGGTP